MGIIRSNYIPKDDFSQANLMIKHVQREYANEATPNGGEEVNVFEDTRESANVYFDNTWIFSVLHALVESVENREDAEVMNIHMELEKLLTPLQNDILLEILRKSRVDRKSTRLNSSH